MRAFLIGLIISLCLAVATAQQSSQLSGYVKYSNYTPAQGVVLTIGRYSVVTDATGYYTFTFVKPGVNTVSVSPPRKSTRSFKVPISSKATRLDFMINW